MAPPTPSPSAPSPTSTQLTEQEYKDSASLDTYITKYKTENGRRYHAYKDGSYWGPNDESANDGQDLTHAIYSMTLGSLHFAPVSSPQQILDIGTGTGIWAIEMGDAHPNAQVLGTDLSPIQPELIPPNCIFEIDDCEMDWTWPDNHFDYIHVRDLHGSIRDWSKFMKEAFRCCKPGGIVELVDHNFWPKSDDGSVTDTHFFTTWGRTITTFSRPWGKPFDVYAHTSDFLRRANFVEIQDKKFFWPIGGWHTDPKLREIGLMNQVRLLDNVEAYGLRLFTSAGKWSRERAQVFLAEMRRAVKDPKAKAYQEVTFAYGRKPK